MAATVLLVKQLAALGVTSSSRFVLSVLKGHLRYRAEARIVPLLQLLRDLLTVRSTTLSRAYVISQLHVPSERQIPAALRRVCKGWAEMNMNILPESEMARVFLEGLERIPTIK